MVMEYIAGTDLSCSAPHDFDNSEKSEKSVDRGARDKEHGVFSDGVAHSGAAIHAPAEADSVVLRLGVGACLMFIINLSLCLGVSGFFEEIIHT